jgi:ATP-dependent Clp protease adaptor protein ClpS
MMNQHQHDEENEQEMVKEFEQEQDVKIGLPYMVVLYNDDWHTFEQVIVQIMKAIQCDFEKARGFAFEAHVKGKSIVFNGQLSECLKVSSILEIIALHTQIVS